jgi:hypothetical protein
VVDTGHTGMRFEGDYRDSGVVEQDAAAARGASQVDVVLFLQERKHKVRCRSEEPGGR